MCQNTYVLVPPPPPPRLWLARLSTLVVLRKKSFLGTCATFEAGSGPRKKKCVVPPPPFFLIPGSAPDYKCKYLRNKCIVNAAYKQPKRSVTVNIKQTLIYVLFGLIISCAQKVGVVLARHVIMIVNKIHDITMYKASSQSKMLNTHAVLLRMQAH